MSSGFVVGLLSYIPSNVRNFFVPPMPIPDVKNNKSKVQLSRLSHVYYQHSDLETFRRFAKDFGLVEVKDDGDTIYFRGYGIDQYVYVAQKGRPQFRGPVFVAASHEEFDKATKIPGASLHSLENAPGGGRMITFARPNGTFFHVLYGQEERIIDSRQPPSETHETQGPYNLPFEKPRLGQFQRYHPGPALVHKLGHFGYVCKEFDTELDFYTSNFNFVHSDVLYHPTLPHVDVMTFMHLDLGDAYSDHHCFFMQRAPPGTWKTYVHHSSYEVSDFDTQLIGHQWLADKRWKSIWGVGRHVLGSQIFDYWADSTGFKVEHYADGDLVNKGTLTRRDALGPLSVWGPELPKDFGNDGVKYGYWRL